MSAQVRVVWDPGFTAYDFGPAHPMSPVRLDLTARLCEELGVFAQPGVEVFSPPVPDDSVLETVHEPDYVAAVRTASQDPASADSRRGLGTEDDPAFRGMHEASARVAEGTRQVCADVWESRAQHGVNFCGGLHHAMAGNASGFCIYNDIAVGIQWLLDHGAQRVAYVDVDVHHGDGVQSLFWDDPRVLTISLHESGRTLFPGTGFPDEIGGAGAEGTAVNVALPAGTGDTSWLRAFHAVVPPLVRAFAPDILVSQHGCDSHALDPLTNLLVSLDGQRTAHAALHGLAHEVCEGRWIATGGGGYELVRVVPRSWTHLLAEAAGSPIEPEMDTPDEWRELVHERTETHAPLRMTDGRMPVFSTYDGTTNTDPADAAIRATRDNVFHYHRLQP